MKLAVGLVVDRVRVSDLHQPLVPHYLRRFNRAHGEHLGVVLLDGAAVLQHVLWDAVASLVLARRVIMRVVDQLTFFELVQVNLRRLL